MNETIKLIKNHRSIRKFTEQAIERELLLTILEAAQQGSTSSYLQPYSVIRVHKKDRSTIAELSGGQPYIESAAEFLVFCADLKRLSDMAKKHDIDADKGYTESFIIGTVDVSIFAQNVLLAAESFGLGGVYIGGIRNNPQALCDLLHIPEEVYPVFGLCIGYPAQSPDLKPRLPLDVILKDGYYNTDEGEIDTYDLAVKEYYIKRTRGKIEDTWSEQVANKLSGELRPHMKEFLEKRSLNKK